MRERDAGDGGGVCGEQSAPKQHHLLGRPWRDDDVPSSRRRRMHHQRSWLVGGAWNLSDTGLQMYFIRKWARALAVCATWDVLISNLG